MPSSAPMILIVPGLRDHVPEHWQTHLAHKLPDARSVPPLTANKLSCAARVAALDAALAQYGDKVILVAHSAGVLMVAHWATRHSRPIHGALLVTPPDIEIEMPEGYPRLKDLQEHGWLPIPRASLPFPSLVIASSNDPLAQPDKVADLARSWGSKLLNLGPVGHLNPASGHGEWPEVENLIQTLI